jgi:hypothetical protein
MENNVKLSICASAIRPQNWLRVYDSLKSYGDNFEIVFVGNVRPAYDLPKNFTYIYSTVKPAQCYEIAFRNAKGELLMWTADDALYSQNAVNTVYDFFKKFNNKKLVVGFCCIEDERDITDIHRFRYKDMQAPRMAPFGVMDREYFHQLGGYDKQFICGQSENDVVMRVYEDGGSMEICRGAHVWVEHRKMHHEGTVFRTNWYHEDRKVLEGCWVGADNSVLTKRTRPLDPFSNEGILTTTQGQRGDW